MVRGLCGPRLPQKSCHPPMSCRPQKSCHPERTVCFASRSKHAVEGSLLFPPLLTYPAIQTRPRGTRTNHPLGILRLRYPIRKANRVTPLRMTNHVAKRTPRENNKLTPLPRPNCEKYSNTTPPRRPPTPPANPRPPRKDQSAHVPTQTAPDKPSGIPAPTKAGCFLDRE
jgi:hypothetical protein